MTVLDSASQLDKLDLPTGLFSAATDAPREPAPVTVTYTPVGSMTLDGNVLAWTYPCAGESATATLK